MSLDVLFGLGWPQHEALDDSLPFAFASLRWVYDLVALEARRLDETTRMRFPVRML